jgi:hypothetical protein
MIDWSSQLAPLNNRTNFLDLRAGRPPQARCPRVGERSPGSAVDKVPDLANEIASWPAIADMVRAHSNKSVPRFERIGAASCLLKPQRRRLLQVLLHGISEFGGCDVLRPIWTAEVIHRANAFAELIMLLDERSDCRRFSALEEELEHRLAQWLAECCRAVTIRSDREIRPCSILMRDIVTNLVGLVGPAAAPGHIMVRTCIERVSLPAFKRRALILAGNTLMTKLITHLIRQRNSATIDVALSVIGSGVARLTITNSNCSLSLATQPALLFDLASLLEAEFASQAINAGTALDIAFSIRS